MAEGSGASYNEIQVHVKPGVPAPDSPEDIKTTVGVTVSRDSVQIGPFAHFKRDELIQALNVTKADLERIYG
jgi:hypothetical protein